MHQPQRSLQYRLRRAYSLPGQQLFPYRTAVFDHPLLHAVAAVLTTALVCCRHAFAADSLLSLVYQIVRGSYPPVPAERFSQGMIDLVQQLLSTEASQRPSLQQVNLSWGSGLLHSA